MSSAIELHFRQNKHLFIKSVELKFRFSKPLAHTVSREITNKPFQKVWQVIMNQKGYAHNGSISIHHRDKRSLLLMSTLLATNKDVDCLQCSICFYHFYLFTNLFYKFNIPNSGIDGISEFVGDKYFHEKEQQITYFPEFWSLIYLKSGVWRQPTFSVPTWCGVRSPMKFSNIGFGVE